jgi:type III restriction enzyme
MTAGGIENPILNGPYDAPAQHFELGSHGPTGTIIDGRRPSESFIPVPAPRKAKNQGQQQLDLVAGERREQNESVVAAIRWATGADWIEAVNHRYFDVGRLGRT